MMAKAGTTIATRAHRAAFPSRLAALALLVLLVSMLGACIDLPRESTPPRYWLLSPIEGAPSAEAPTRTLSVGPIDVPGYLAGLGIVRRSGAHELGVSDFDRWGDSLAEQFTRVLTRNVAVLTPGTATSAYPWRGPEAPDLQLAVVVTRFETDPSGTVSLDARWTLTDLAERAIVAQHDAQVSEPVGGAGAGAGAGTDALVAAMSRAFNALSRQIAAGLGEAAGS